MDLPGLMSVLGNLGGLALVGFLFWKIPTLMKLMASGKEKEWQRWAEENDKNREHDRKRSELFKNTVERITDAFRSTNSDIMLTYREEAQKERAQCWTMFTHLNDTHRANMAVLMEHAASENGKFQQWQKEENERLMVSIMKAIKTLPEKQHEPLRASAWHHGSVAPSDDTPT